MATQNKIPTPKKAKNPLLSGADIGFPFDNFCGSAILMPIAHEETTVPSTVSNAPTSFLHSELSPPKPVAPSTSAQSTPLFTLFKQVLTGEVSTPAPPPLTTANDTESVPLYAPTITSIAQPNLFCPASNEQFSSQNVQNNNVTSPTMFTVGVQPGVFAPRMNNTPPPRTFDTNNQQSLEMNLPPPPANEPSPRILSPNVQNIPGTNTPPLGLTQSPTIYNPNVQNVSGTITPPLGLMQPPRIFNPNVQNIPGTIPPPFGLTQPPRIFSPNAQNISGTNIPPLGFTQSPRLFNPNVQNMTGTNTTYSLNSAPKMFVPDVQQSAGTNTSSPTIFSSYAQNTPPPPMFTPSVTGSDILSASAHQSTPPPMFAPSNVQTGNPPNLYSATQPFSLYSQPQQMGPSSNYFTPITDSRPQSRSSRSSRPPSANSQSIPLDKSSRPSSVASNPSFRPDSAGPGPPPPIFYDPTQAPEISKPPTVGGSNIFRQVKSTRRYAVGTGSVAPLQKSEFSNQPLVFGQPIANLPSSMYAAPYNSSQHPSFPPIVAPQMFEHSSSSVQYGSIPQIYSPAQVVTTSTEQNYANLQSALPATAVPSMFDRNILPNGAEPQLQQPHFFNPTVFSQSAQSETNNPNTVTPSVDSIRPQMFNTNSFSQTVAFGNACETCGACKSCDVCEICYPSQMLQTSSQPNISEGNVQKVEHPTPLQGFGQYLQEKVKLQSQPVEPEVSAVPNNFPPPSSTFMPQLYYPSVSTQNTSTPEPSQTDLLLPIASTPQLFNGNFFNQTVTSQTITQIEHQPPLTPCTSQTLDTNAVTQNITVNNDIPPPSTVTMTQIFDPNFHSQGLIAVEQQNQNIPPAQTFDSNVITQNITVNNGIPPPPSVTMTQIFDTNSHNQDLIAAEQQNQNIPPAQTFDSNAITQNVTVNNDIPPPPPVTVTQIFDPNSHNQELVAAEQQNQNIPPSQTFDSNTITQNITVNNDIPPPPPVTVTQIFDPNSHNQELVAAEQQNQNIPPSQTFDSNKYLCQVNNETQYTHELSESQMFDSNSFKQTRSPINVQETATLQSLDSDVLTQNVTNVSQQLNELSLQQTKEPIEFKQISPSQMVDAFKFEQDSISNVVESENFPVSTDVNKEPDTCHMSQSSQVCESEGTYTEKDTSQNPFIKEEIPREFTAPSPSRFFASSDDKTSSFFDQPSAFVSTTPVSRPASSTNTTVALFFSEASKQSSSNYFSSMSSQQNPCDFFAQPHVESKPIVKQESISENRQLPVSSFTTKSTDLFNQQSASTSPVAFFTQPVQKPEPLTGTKSPASYFSTGNAADFFNQPPSSRESQLNKASTGVASYFTQQSRDFPQADAHKTLRQTVPPVPLFSTVNTPLLSPQSTSAQPEVAVQENISPSTQQTSTSLFSPRAKEHSFPVNSSDPTIPTNIPLFSPQPVAQAPVLNPNTSHTVQSVPLFPLNTSQHSNVIFDDPNMPPATVSIPQSSTGNSFSTTETSNITLFNPYSSEISSNVPQTSQNIPLFTSDIPQTFNAVSFFNPDSSQTSPTNLSLFPSNTLLSTPGTEEHRSPPSIPVSVSQIMPPRPSAPLNPYSKSTSTSSHPVAVTQHAVLSPQDPSVTAVLPPPSLQQTEEYPPPPPKSAMSGGGNNTFRLGSRPQYAPPPGLGSSVSAIASLAASMAVSAPLPVPGTAPIIEPMAVPTMPSIVANAPGIASAAELFRPQSMPGDASTTSYSPVHHHWFYKREIEGKTIWNPFSVIDSIALEQAYSSGNSEAVVATDGGRYDVHVARRLREPIYWNQPGNEVRRCSWFYRGALDSRSLPYEEAFAAKLEEEYRVAFFTNRWPRRVELSYGEAIVLNGPTAMMHLPPTSGSILEDWGSIQEQGTKPRTVRRGCDEFDIDEGEQARPDHLLFLVHGIGSVCDLKFRSVVEVVDDFRSLALTLVRSHFRQAGDEGRVARVEVLPVSWHGALHGEETGIDRQLQGITLKSIPRLRHFTNDTLLDILFYTSPVYCQTIIRTVGHELNRLQQLFMKRNPDFSGGISLGGHSLGSLILFDLLCHQRPSAKARHVTPPRDPSLFKSDEDEEDEDEFGEPIPPPRHLVRRESCRVDYMMGPAGTGQPSISYPQLHFSPSAFFALGSPIAMFVTVRGIESLGCEFCLPTCPAFFNIFHPFDPVAYRVESLVNTDMGKLKPVVIPHHKGRKRMHIELRETMTRVGADLKERLVDSVRSTWNTVYQLAMFNRGETLEHEFDKVLAEQMLAQDALADEQSGFSETYSDWGESDTALMGRLNSGRRIDYVLQEAPLESFNEYLFALGSHVCYWESEDTMLLMLKEIYAMLGINPDKQFDRSREGSVVRERLDGVRERSWSAGSRGSGTSPSQRFLDPTRPTPPFSTPPSSVSRH